MIMIPASVVYFILGFITGIVGLILLANSLNKKGKK